MPSPFNVKPQGISENAFTLHVNPAHDIKKGQFTKMVPCPLITLHPLLIFSSKQNYPSTPYTSIWLSAGNGEGSSALISSLTLIHSIPFFSMLNS